MKNAPCTVAIIAMMIVSSCQRRAVCKVKTANGGYSFARVYANSFNTKQEYYDAIGQYKKNGYTCDDSATID